MEKRKRIVITGGTGFLGLSLATFLKNHGYHPVLVARNEPWVDFDFVSWDGINLGNWAKALDNAEAIINLAGKSVNCIKSPDNCDLILRSRVDTTKLIGRAMRVVQNPPKVWIQMSTAHIYGDPPSQVCTEESAIGIGLAPHVGLQWEKAFLESLPEGVRGVRLRTSFVLGRNGGALNTLKRLVHFGLGGKVGSGKQGMSWIHEEDLNRIVLDALQNSSYSGVYIASAPNPVSNLEFMLKLRAQMKVPFGLPAPEFLVKLGARFILRTDSELALYGRYVKPKRLEKVGFHFRYPRISDAFENLLKLQTT